MYILNLMSMFVSIFHWQKGSDNLQYNTCDIQSCLYLHSRLFNLMDILNKCSTIGIDKCFELSNEWKSKPGDEPYIPGDRESDALQKSLYLHPSKFGWTMLSWGQVIWFVYGSIERKTGYQNIHKWLRFRFLMAIK